MNRLPLILGLALRRYGALPPLAALLAVVSVALHLAVLPRVEASLLSERARLSAIDMALVQARVKREPAGLPPQRTNHDAFRGILRPAAETAAAVAQVFDLAKARKLALSQAEYRWSRDVEGSFRTFEITLPIKATFPALRDFIDDVLVSMPGVALDEAWFRRESIGATEVEARLRITVFVRDTE